jgi:mycothiol synthase
MAGFCWTKVHAAATATAEGEGEIYAIGVDPALHGRGIGRALAVAGFAHLAARGLRHGMLFVRGDNAAARSLYASLGLTEERRDEVFVGSVAARPSGKMRPRPGAGPA